MAYDLSNLGMEDLQQLSGNSTGKETPNQKAEKYLNSKYPSIAGLHQPYTPTPSNDWTLTDEQLQKNELLKKRANEDLGSIGYPGYTWNGAVGKMATSSDGVWNTTTQLGDDGKEVVTNNKAQSIGGWWDKHMPDLTMAFLAAAGGAGLAGVGTGGAAAGAGAGEAGAGSISALTPEAAYAGGLGSSNAAVAGMGGASGIGSAGGALSVAGGAAGGGLTAADMALAPGVNGASGATAGTAGSTAGDIAAAQGVGGTGQGLTAAANGGGLSPGFTTGNSMLDSFLKSQATGLLSGGKGGSTGTNGSNLGGGLLNGLGSLYDLYANNKAANQVKPALDTLNNMYSPGTPEALQMQKDMDARDAAAGRRSQYGTRAVELAGKLAQAKGNILSSPGYLNLNQSYAQNKYGGVGGALGALNQSGLGNLFNQAAGGLINKGANSLWDYFSGSGGGNTPNTVSAGGANMETPAWGGADQGTNEMNKLLNQGNNSGVDTSVADNFDMSNWGDMFG